jgi:hypothetical protein
MTHRVLAWVRKQGAIGREYPMWFSVELVPIWNDNTVSYKTDHDTLSTLWFQQHGAKWELFHFDWAGREPRYEYTNGTPVQEVI